MYRIQCVILGFWVLTAVLLKIRVFWHINGVSFVQVGSYWVKHFVCSGSAQWWRIRCRPRCETYKVVRFQQLINRYQLLFRIWGGGGALRRTWASARLDFSASARSPAVATRREENSLRLPLSISSPYHLSVKLSLDFSTIYSLTYNSLYYVIRWFTTLSVPVKCDMMGSAWCCVSHTAHAAPVKRTTHWITNTIFGQKFPDACFSKAVTRNFWSTTWNRESNWPCNPKCGSTLAPQKISPQIHSPTTSNISNKISAQFLSQSFDWIFPE